MTMTDARLRPTRRPRREGAAARRLETGRGRVVLASLIFAVAFAGLGLRLIDVAVLGGGHAPEVARRAAAKAPVQRAAILDRNGIILATTLPTYSLYADARQVPDAMAAATHLVRILPNLKYAKLLRKQRGILIVHIFF